MKLRLFCLAVCLSAMAFAQQAQGPERFDPDYLKENTPASPETSSLGTYGDVSNNPYNGKLNLGVPLHSINFEGLVIPINLSYDSGGFRPAQESSWVGLNWSLSGRAQITRNIYGNDDLNENVIPNSNTEISAWPFNDFEVSYTSNGVPNVPLTEIVSIHQGYAVGGGGTTLVAPHLSPDTQPDIYEVNLFGTSYRFRFEKRVGTGNTLTTHIFDNKNAQIDYNLSTRTFTVWDDNGFQFVFGTKEYSASLTSSKSTVSTNATSNVKEDTVDGLLGDLNQGNNTVITAWVLDQITSPTGDIINFSYNEGAHFSMPQFPGSVGFNESAQEHNDDIGPVYHPNNVDYTCTMSIIYTQYLDKITGRFGEVVFVSQEDRRDLITGNDLTHIYPGTFLPAFNTQSKTTVINSIDHRHGTPNNPQTHYQNTGRRLDRIDVKDFNGTVTKTVNFTQTYFENDRLGNSDEAAYLRLKLDKVEVNDLSYSFEYNLPDDLPVKNTLDIDFWGFYNGANNSTHVPSIGRFCSVQTMAPNANALDMKLGHVYYKFNGGDRGANHTFSKKGMLTKITYPTGGYSEISYEGNKAGVNGPSPYVVTDTIPGTNIMLWSNLINEDKYEFTYQYLKNAASSSYNFYDNRYDPNTANTTEIPWSINDTFTVATPIIVNGQGDLQMFTPGEGVAPYADIMKYYVQDMEDESKVYPLFYVGHWEGATSGGSSAGYGDESVLVPSGSYRIKRRSGGEMLLGEPAVGLQPEDFKRIEGDLAGAFEEFEVGGLRVKSLSTYDNNQGFIKNGIRLCIS